MSIILSPTDETQLVDVINEAKSKKTALKVQGGGTRAGLGNPINSDATLSLKKINGIELYDPAGLVLVVKAGTSLKQIEKTLAVEGQRLAFEPTDYRHLFATKGEPTIGGIVAANISGSRRISVGACRDALLGVRFVTGNGYIIKNGGRVMKNVTGLDLVKLMAGSYGTLGVLTEVSFKVLPTPERQATLVINSASTDEAVKTMSAALGSPFEITGAVYRPKTNETLLRIEGFSDQVDYRLEKLRALVAPKSDAKIIDGTEHMALWRSIRDVKFIDTPDAVVWRISVKPSDAPSVATYLKTMNANLLLDWGGGLIWAEIPGESIESALNIRKLVREKGGHAMLIRASENLRNKASSFQPEPKGVATLSACIRKKFDPDGILNPNFMTNGAG